ncbi:alpha-beta hydrolase esterase [Flexivirga endophytica]|uniref:Alpha-beta hydrolase esterase n=1 Tax=Flexivirga endophytica TaxID=1849103 RepID=A0A916T5L1_9MICO|nr:patatin family protein [Flexivirga endophytica]GGB32755.1 alpha-beta hydrolase esterase [Flexivirga endophytica]GHB40741.1 alpha-beta hydrolase esterase [Flexivirga endophytica]
MSTDPTAADAALVIEGGAMRGSHSAGFVVTLIDAGIRLPWVAGISSGATNASNYITRDVWRAHASFTTFAQEPEFGGWRTFVRRKGIFNAEFIYQQSGLPDNVLPFDWQSYVESPDEWKIGAFDATTGETIYWGRDDMKTLPDLLTRVQASASMPVLMPPVKLDGHLYVDGALGTSGGIALDAAQADGFDKFVVVLTQPRSYVKTPEGKDWFFKTYYRRYPAVAEAMRTRATRYNRTREELFELEKAGKAYVFAPEIEPVSNGERRLPVLEASYRAGYDQAQRELPAIRDFLGLA